MIFSNINKHCQSYLLWNVQFGPFYKMDVICVSHTHICSNNLQAWNIIYDNKELMPTLYCIRTLYLYEILYLTFCKEQYLSYRMLKSIYQIGWYHFIKSSQTFFFFLLELIFILLAPSTWNGCLLIITVVINQSII